jgi:hypothetical protein
MTFWQMFWVTIGSILSFSILLILLISGSRYSSADAEKHATDYAGVIREGHGPVTVFLWTIYIGLSAWMIVYLVLHWHEFAVIGAYAQ